MVVEIDSEKKHPLPGWYAKRRNPKVPEMKSKLNNGAMINEKELNEKSSENMGNMYGP